MVLLDMSCCCENMLIEAAELGLGSVWISFAPRPQRTEPAEKVLKLPEHLKLFTVLPVGHPMGNLKPLDRFEEARIHWPEK
jgi:nitroreductase